LRVKKFSSCHSPLSVIAGALVGAPTLAGFAVLHELCGILAALLAPAVARWHEWGFSARTLDIWVTLALACARIEDLVRGACTRCQRALAGAVGGVEPLDSTASLGISARTTASLRVLDVHAGIGAVILAPALTLVCVQHLIGGTSQGTLACAVGRVESKQKMMLKPWSWQF
jgi:hypothetical protein